MDPALLALVIALVGNAVAIFVVVISNVSASRREQRRLDREDDRLELQRSDDRLRQAREDRWRVIEFQRDDYVKFYRELRAVSLVIHEAGYAGAPLPVDWQLSAFEELVRLRVFASEAAYEKATEAYSALFKWGALGGVDFESDEEVRYQAALNDYLAAIRHDLGVVMDENRLSADDIVS